MAVSKQINVFNSHQSRVLDEEEDPAKKGGGELCNLVGGGGKVNGAVNLSSSSQG